MDGVGSQSPPAPPTPAPLTQLKGAQIVARVGPEAITYNEVMAGSEELVEANKERMSEAELERAMQEVLRQRLEQHVDSKLVYYDARRTIPADNFPNVEKRLSQAFEAQEIPRLMKAVHAESRTELEAKLLKSGTSIDRTRRAFVQRMLAQQWVREKINPDEEPTYDQMMAYYCEHLKDFEHPAKARWEEIMLLAAKYPSEADARAALGRLGGGRPRPNSRTCPATRGGRAGLFVAVCHCLAPGS